jgi:hypothetical protein
MHFVISYQKLFLVFLQSLLFFNFLIFAHHFLHCFHQSIYIFIIHFNNIMPNFMQQFILIVLILLLELILIFSIIFFVNLFNEMNQLNMLLFFLFLLMLIKLYLYHSLLVKYLSIQYMMDFHIQCHICLIIILN